MSPTARSLRQLRQEGAIAQVVESWVPRTRIRRDLFGCIDIVAVIPGEPGCLGIQCTTASNAAARINKASAEPRLAVWLAAGNRFEVWAWGLRGARGARKLWSLTRQSITNESGRKTA